MTYILTRGGRQHQLGGEKTSAPGNVPQIREIAYSLAQINRFTGHCSRPYSVAEHSLLVAETALTVFGASTTVQFACLMHDGHECITGDVSSPVKQKLGAAWKAFEDQEQRNLLRGYNLLDVFREHHHLIKQCDLIALATERRDLTPFDPSRHEAWAVIDTPGQEILPRGISLKTFERNTRCWETWARIFISQATLLQHRSITDSTLTLQKQ